MPLADSLKSAPLLVPEPDWHRINIPTSFGDGQNFVSGEPSGTRLRVAYYRREADGVLCGKAWFGQAAEGPPGHAHGGSIAAVLDEAMGLAAWISGFPVVTFSLNVYFKSPIPLGSDSNLEAWVEWSEGSCVQTFGRIYCPVQNKVFARSQAKFKVQPLERVAASTALTSLAEGVDLNSPMTGDHAG